MHFDERVVTGEKPKSKQGFASMSPERRKAIAAMGGAAANAQGVAHKWDALSARAAGSKGGKNRWKNHPKTAA